jgi:copper chaperone
MSGMDEVREVMMKVDGIGEEGRAEAVRRTIRNLDAEAQVHVDLGRGQINVRTRADTLEVIDALTKAGFNATGTGNV